MEMLPWQQRVVTERNEVTARLEALTKYLKDIPEAYELNARDQALMLTQVGIMKSYIDVLNARVARFNP